MIRAMGCASSSGKKPQKVEPVSQEQEARMGKADELRASALALPRLKFCGECGEKMLEGSQQCVECDCQKRTQPGPTVAVAFNQPRSTWPTRPPPTGVKPSQQHSTMDASSRYQVAAQLANPPTSRPKPISKSFVPEAGVRLQKSLESAQPKSEEQLKGLLGSLLSGPVPLDDFATRSDRIASVPMGCLVPAVDIGKGGKGRKTMTMQEFTDPNKHFQSAAWTASLSR